jgi:hypothetical protein
VTHCAYEGMVSIGSDRTHLFWGAQGGHLDLVGALQRARDLPRSVAASVQGRLQPGLSYRATPRRRLRRLRKGG